MNRSLPNRIREIFSLTLEADSATGTLSAGELACVCALLETLTADPGFPAARCRDHVDAQTGSRPGYLKAYRDGVALLDRAAGGQFCLLGQAGRDAVLHKILRRYPHRSNEARWRQRLRVTGSHLDQIVSRRATRRFRNFVVRDLMRFYFEGAEGWAIVGYEEYPGHVRHDVGPCEVTRMIDDEDGRVLLELSDATIEELDPTSLIAVRDAMLTVGVKAGRLRAGFARAAYYQLVERIDMDGDRFVLRLGDAEFEIPCAE